MVKTRGFTGFLDKDNYELAHGHTVIGTDFLEFFHHPLFTSKGNLEITFKTPLDHNAVHVIFFQFKRKGFSANRLADQTGQKFVFGKLVFPAEYFKHLLCFFV